jgi:hypothetical protein
VIGLRTLVRLLELSLALLLLACVPSAVQDPVEIGPRLVAVGPAQTLIDRPDRPTHDSSLQACSESNGFDGDDGSQPVIATLVDEPVPDPMRLAAPGRISYPTPVSTHRPCAAPPTGPPRA